MSNETFHTFSESVFTMLMIVIGQRSMFTVFSLNTLYKDLFGYSFILLSVLQLNMFIAIVGTHYFEFYLENGGTDRNSFKDVLRYYIDKQKSQNNAANKKCMQRLKAYVINKIDSHLSHESEKESNNVNSGKGIIDLI